MFLRGMNWIIDRLIKIPLDFLGAFHISQRILDPLLVWFQKDISRPAHQLYILTCRWHFLEVRSYSRESKNEFELLNEIMKIKYNVVIERLINDGYHSRYDEKMNSKAKKLTYAY